MTILIGNLLAGESGYKKKLLANAYALYFLSTHTLSYAKEKYHKHASKMFYLPYRFRESEARSKRESFQIIIPGGENRANRTYEFLIHFLENIKLTQKIEIVFLGLSRPHTTNSPISKLKRFESDLLNTRIFDQYLNQEEYHNWIRQADVLLAPLKKEVQYMGYSENYGISKITGSIADAYRAQVPLILPAFYPIEKIMADQIYTYSDQDSFDRSMAVFYPQNPKNLSSRSEANIQEKATMLYNVLFR